MYIQLCDINIWATYALITILNIKTGTMGNEALVMTKDKNVYALGSNTSGCLGTGDMHSTLYPKKIEALCEKGIKTFAYGSGPHVLALTDKGEVCL